MKLLFGVSIKKNENVCTTKSRAILDKATFDKGTWLPMKYIISTVSFLIMTLFISMKVSALESYVPDAELNGQLTLESPQALTSTLSMWVTEFKKMHANVYIRLNPNGATPGFDSLMSDSSTIAMTTKKLARVERRQFVEKYGYKPRKAQVGTISSLSERNRNEALFMYVNNPPHASLTDITKAFLQFVTSDRGQKIAVENGYAAISEAISMKNARKLDYIDELNKMAEQSSRRIISSKSSTVRRVR